MYFNYLLFKAAKILDITHEKTHPIYENFTQLMQQCQYEKQHLKLKEND